MAGAAALVGGFNKISDKFVDEFLTKDGETVEQAKARLAQEQAAREAEKAETQTKALTFPWYNAEE